MNIIDINLKKLQIEIEEYINNSEQKKGSIISKYTTPVLLMNYDTLKLLESYNSFLLKEKIIPFMWTFCGCYICIANWLSLGEVEIR